MKTFIFFLLLVIVSSCNSTKKEVKIVETYPNGNIKLTHTLKNDSVYFREEYYENGNHKTAVFVKNNKFDGRWGAYTVDNKVKEYGDYKDGKKVGNWKYNFWVNPFRSIFIDYLPNGDSIINVKQY